MHLVAQCVDLRATFAGRFRFEWDESDWAERPEFRAVEAPWLTVIPGRLGRIFPWGGRLLAAYTTVRSARRSLEILDGVTVRQGGTVGDKTSSEIIVTFDVSLIDAVAAILGSKRPRKCLTPDRRALLVERGRRFRFPTKEDGANEGLARPDSTNGPQGGFTPRPWRGAGIPYVVEPAPRGWSAPRPGDSRSTEDARTGHHPKRRPRSLSQPHRQQDNHDHNRDHSDAGS
jgi:hypothetical protein